MEEAEGRVELYHAEQAKAEAALIRRRRDEAEGFPDAGQDFARVREAEGLALSGGGIRSATFNLGLVQSLAAARKLKDFDYLSTVSGGGYIGAFLGRLYHRAAGERAGPGAANSLSVEAVLASDQAPVVRWLRDNGRYLAPHGLKDRLFAFGIYLRNMLSVHVLLGMMLLAMFLSFGFLRVGLAKAAPMWAGAPYDITVSPAWLLAGLCALAMLGLAWAYWMHRENRSLALEQQGVAGLLAFASAATLGARLLDATPNWAWFWSAGLIVALAWAVADYRRDAPKDRRERGTAALAAIVGAAVLWLLVPWGMFALARHVPDVLLICAVLVGTVALLASLFVRQAAETIARTRHRLSTWLRWTLSATLACSLLALLDTAAYYAFTRLIETREEALLSAGAIGAVLAGLRVFAQAMATRVGRRRNSGMRWIKRLLNAVGILLLALVALAWAVAAIALVWFGSRPGTSPGNLEPALFAALVAAGFCLLAGRHLDVLNLSSLHPFYAARLARAYLGAGNKERGVPWSTVPQRSPGLKAVSQVSEGDDMAWADYRPHLHGGPLHLVNINVNQTRYLAGGDFQPDRQGWNLAIGPAGFNLGRSRWEPGTAPGARGEPPAADGPISPTAWWSNFEPLKLSCWIAISGAAFTTGAGPRTGLGFSALLGLLGARLGYWWRSGDIVDRRVPAMLRALRDELTGAFDPDRSTHWYLSDGGHFENCGAYELVRRGLKRIVVADCGADPRYELDDLANLVLKARIDFAAEISFFGAGDLGRLFAGKPALRALFADPDAMTSRLGPALLLAAVRYPNDPVPGWLLVVKPRLPAELPFDLAFYAEHQEDFPQQTTLDQFYDESQWEATHTLGRLLGAQLSDALDALPQALAETGAALPPIFEGASWGRDSERDAAAPAGTDSGGSGGESLLKIYAPIALALWTGFEFYSNHQQQQAKEAAENVKFALARTDLLERQVFGQPGCGPDGKMCPTVPAQVALVRGLLDKLPPATAQPVGEILARLDAAINVARPSPDRALAVADASTLGPADKRPAVSPEAKSRALVYVQIYDEERRPAARQLIERLQQAGLDASQTPGIENVVRTAEATKAKTPATFASTTVIYYHLQDRALADWIAGEAAAGGREIKLLDLSRSRFKVRPGLLEVWLP